MSEQNIPRMTAVSYADNAIAAVLLFLPPAGMRGRSKRKMRMVRGGKVLFISCKKPSNAPIAPETVAVGGGGRCSGRVHRLAHRGRGGQEAN
jgi:hypothetical protein